MPLNDPSTVKQSAAEDFEEVKVELKDDSESMDKCSSTSSFQTESDTESKEENMQLPAIKMKQSVSQKVPLRSSRLSIS